MPPTLTPPPTVDVAKVQTEAAGTAVAQMAQNATATAAAIPTSTATPTPTATPQPTVTSTPTTKPTAKPSNTPKAEITLELSGMRYEKWGRPVRGCSAFDDNSCVRKFNLEISLTNHTDKAIDEWYPDFHSNGGSLLFTCFYVYSAEGFPSVPPGEKRTVTFASFCELNEYVKDMLLKVNDKEQRRCFSPEGVIIACAVGAQTSACK
jgi:hypothetical protein